MESYLRLDLFSDVEPALRRLSWYKLAILSNGSPEMLAAVTENAGLTGTFAGVISVEEVGIYKPSPRVYSLASRRLDVTSSAIAFVSSNFWDVAGAKSFGFWTCWLNRDRLPEDELGVTSDVTVDALGGLVTVLS